MNEEVFLPIKGHEDYFVSNKGRVLSKKWDARILKPHIQKGYCSVTLDNKPYFIHRLVASAFIPNPHNYSYINHKNEIPNDNRVENLEWCTEDYNIHYGTHLKRASEGESTEIVQCDLNGNEIARYKSMTEASKQTGVSVASICVNARGNGQSGLRKSCGYVWRIGDKDHRHPTKKTYRKYY